MPGVYNFVRFFLSSSQWHKYFNRVDRIRFLIRSFFPDFRAEDSGRSEHVHQFHILGPGVPAVTKEPYPENTVLNHSIPTGILWPCVADPGLIHGSWFRIFPSRIQRRKDPGSVSYQII
jgi:hypothetical protein